MPSAVTYLLLFQSLLAGHALYMWAALPLRWLYVMLLQLHCASAVLVFVAIARFGKTAAVSVPSAVLLLVIAVALETLFRKCKVQHRLRISRDTHKKV